MQVTYPYTVSNVPRTPRENIFETDTVTRLSLRLRPSNAHIGAELKLRFVQFQHSPLHERSRLVGDALYQSLVQCRICAIEGL